MKIKDVQIGGRIPNNYEEIISCYQDKNNDDRICVSLGTTDATTLLTATSRINRILASSIGIDYPTFLEIMKKCAFFDERYGNLNLSDEQISKMVGKDLKGFNLKK